MKVLITFLLRGFCIGSVAAFLAGSSVLAQAAGDKAAAEEPQSQKQEPQRKDQKTAELPKKGVLSATGGGAHAGVALEGPWGGTNLEGKPDNPISGSVSRISARDWVAKVVNNTEDAYRANVAIVQYDERRQKLKTDNFSVSLKAKQTVERTFRANPSTYFSTVELNGWKRFPKKKTREELEAEIAQKKQELQDLEQQLAALPKQ